MTHLEVYREVTETPAKRRIVAKGQEALASIKGGHIVRFSLAPLLTPIRFEPDDATTPLRPTTKIGEVHRDPIELRIDHLYIKAYRHSGDGEDFLFCPEMGKYFEKDTT